MRSRDLVVQRVLGRRLRPRSDRCRPRRRSRRASASRRRSRGCPSRSRRRGSRGGERRHRRASWSSSSTRRVLACVPVPNAMPGSRSITTSPSARRVRLPARDDDELPRQPADLEVALPRVAPLGLGHRGRRCGRAPGSTAAPPAAQRATASRVSASAAATSAGGDPEHDLVAALLGTRGGGGNFGRDQRRDVVDVGRADRNDDLDPVSHAHEAPLQRAGTLSASDARRHAALHLAAEALAGLARLPLLLDRGFS